MRRLVAILFGIQFCLYASLIVWILWGFGIAFVGCLASFLTGLSAIVIVVMDRAVTTKAMLAATAAAAIGFASSQTPYYRWTDSAEVTFVVELTSELNRDWDDISLVLVCNGMEHPLGSADKSGRVVAKTRVDLVGLQSLVGRRETVDMPGCFLSARQGHAELARVQLPPCDIDRQRNEVAIKVQLK